MTEEERQLTSSDLEDCEEVWVGDLGEYMLDTQKRLKQVERWFNFCVLVSCLAPSVGVVPSHWLSLRKRAQRRRKQCLVITEID
jgi:hypothetical protein